MATASKASGTHNKKRNLRRTHLLELGAALLIIVFANIISNYFFGRIDLTAEKRYTLSPATKSLLKAVDEPVLFRVYLEGDFPSDYQRLQHETRDMLNQFRAYNRNIEYEFVNPNAYEDPKEQRAFYDKLAQKGIQPSYIQVKKADGVTQQIIIPAADVIYKGNETSIQLLTNQAYVANDIALNNSIQNLEYVLSNAIRGLSRVFKPHIGFLTGHGELERGSIYDIQLSLLENYRVENVPLTEDINVLTGRVRNADSTVSLINKFDLLIVPKPQQPFTDQELFILDQFVMYGGKILWLIDPLNADLDSLADQGQTIATRLPLNLDEMLFAYGVRVNPNLIMDIRCRPIPMNVGYVGDKPQIDFRPWLYFPDIIPLSKHPIVRNLDIIKTDFVSGIDLIENDITKTILLASSEYSRVKNAPVIIDLNETKTDIQQMDRRLFNKQHIPVSVLLEGTFRSMWRNRLAPSFTQIPEMGYKTESEPTKMIVISDGDIIKNRFNYKENSSYPLGYDYYTNTMYANKQFLLNCIDYLTGEEDILNTRSRDISLRKLNVIKAHEWRKRCQWFNVLLPVVLILCIAPIVALCRRRRYVARNKQTNGYRK
ncbi:MAG: gliding motility-associated ABC transporter substrate-binding protein GldG [Bacteroidales bacterium]|nr:gliding motility-associated ABC transporter substrate-binding protein GldG [Bacteroidales bacterium]